METIWINWKEYEVVDGKVSIPVEDAIKAQDRIDHLEALEAGGVDNWEWYSESLINAGLISDED